MVMVDSGDSLTTEMLVKRILARSSFNTTVICEYRDKMPCGGVPLFHRASQNSDSVTDFL